MITNGSVQAPQTLYWFAAQTLAKAGYVVLTFDPQGQGVSDTFGEGPDRNDGYPSQEGRPFYDGTEDALDFFFSSPRTPYAPRPSCTSNTSHIDKQQARVADGRSSAYNPLHDRLDRKRVGLVGHSLGASAGSYIGQLDPRVKAIVAYDNLRDVTQANDITCESGSSPRPATQAITKPALGLAGDYGLVPQPYLEAPDPQAKSRASLAATAAGVDTGEIVIRGGTHFEFSYIPNPAFTATLRGIDLTAWYTTAWMDYTVKRDASALLQLTSTRWRNDARNAAIDGNADPNMFSTLYTSRLDVAGFLCEDLRVGCPSQPVDDALPPDYSFLAAAQAPDPGAPPASTAPAGSTGVPPAATGEEARAAIAAAGCPKPTARITTVGRKRIRGTAAASCGRMITRVDVAVGKRAFNVASGTTSWTRRASAQGKRVRLRVTDSAGISRRIDCAASGRCRPGR